MTEVGEHQGEAVREELLARLMSQGVKRSSRNESTAASSLLNQVIIGLVFAHRPITSAGADMITRYNLGPRGPFILSLVDNGVQHPKDLATILRIGRSLVTSELQRLTSAGLIETAAGRDRRLLHLTLTESGRSANAATRAMLAGTIERALTGYTADQIALFAAMLQDIQRHT